MSPICGLIHGFNYCVINKNMTLDEYKTIRTFRNCNIFRHTQDILTCTLVDELNTYHSEDYFGKYGKDVAMMLRTPYVEDCPIQNHMYDYQLSIIVDSMKLSKVKSLLGWCIKPRDIRNRILNRPFHDGNSELMDAYNLLDKNEKHYFLLFHVLRFCILNERQSYAEDLAMINNNPTVYEDTVNAGNQTPEFKQIMIDDYNECNIEHKIMKLRGYSSDYLKSKL